MDQFREQLIEGLKEVKNVVTTTLKKPLKRLVIIAVIIVIIIISLVSSYNALMDQFSKRTGDHMKNNPVKYNPTDNSIIIEEEQIAILEKMLEELGTSKEKLHLKTENLEKIYAAEVVTQEINRCNTVQDGNPHKIQEEEGKYYGRVYVKRAKETTEDLEDLIYIPFEQFEQLNAEEILKYFSIEEDKLCIAATTIRTDAQGNTTEEITIQKLSYKNQLLPYIMPVEFLLDLIILTENPEFVMALADKVIKETEIIIAVMQEKETIETQTTYKYKTETETMEKIENYDEDGRYIGTDVLGPMINIGPEQTQTKSETTVNITPVIKIVSVKTWFMEQKFIYNKVTTTEIEEIPEDDPSNQILEEPKGTHDYKYITSSTYPDGSSADIYNSEINRKVDQKQSVKITTTKEKYEQGVSEDPKEKTEEKIKEFIKLLKTPFKIPESYREEPAMGDIISGAGILFQMLQNSERTQSVEHIMRYVLYVYTGEDYGVRELDFDLFKPGEFTSVSNIMTTLKSFIRYFEGIKEEDGKYVVYLDTGGNRTVGYGVNIEAQGGRFIARGIDPSKIKEGDKFEKEIIDSIEDEILGEMQTKVESITSGLNLKEYQIHALTSRYYNCGNISGFKDAYNAYWKESDDEYGVTENPSMYNHLLYTKYMEKPTKDNKGNTLPGFVKRRKAEWILFKTGYYISSGNFYQEGGDIIQLAKSIHEHMENNKYSYSLDTKQLATTFEKSKALKKSCCATYVCWVLQEAGYVSEAEHTDSTAALANLLIGKGFTRISNKNEMQPGDVIIYEGHCEIYAGDQTVYNAGSENAIRSSSPQKRTDWSTFKYALRAK